MQFQENTRLFSSFSRWIWVAASMAGVFTFGLPVSSTLAQERAKEKSEKEEAKLVKPAPDRPAGEGEGPFNRLIIRGATVIDGTGGPPRGPMDIVIEGNRIVEVKSVGVPRAKIKEEDRPKDADKELDAHGSYVLPGVVNLHAHVGSIPKSPEAEYIYKLWLSHGITTVRGVSAGPLEWSLSEKARSAANAITAPRIYAYQRPG